MCRSWWVVEYAMSNSYEVGLRRPFLRQSAGDDERQDQAPDESDRPYDPADGQGSQPARPRLAGGAPTAPDPNHDRFGSDAGPWSSHARAWFSSRNSPKRGN